MTRRLTRTRAVPVRAERSLNYPTTTCTPTGRTSRPRTTSAAASSSAPSSSSALMALIVVGLV
jgi:hypothetical protein